MQDVIPPDFWYDLLLSPMCIYLYIYTDHFLFQRFCVAIVVPEEAAFRHWLRDHHFENEADQPLEEICLNIQIRKAFLEEMRNFGTAHDLGNLQQVRRFKCKIIIRKKKLQQ